MRLLSILDFMFLLVEKRKQPMHVGGLFLFEIPEGADEDCSVISPTNASLKTPPQPFLSTKYFIT